MENILIPRCYSSAQPFTARLRLAAAKTEPAPRSPLCRSLRDKNDEALRKNKFAERLFTYRNHDRLNAGMGAADLP